MKHKFFESIEASPLGEKLELETVIRQLAFNTDGLIPVIAQDEHSREVLMLAWMNKAAMRLTLATRQMTYWSRSRQQLWVKGQTSGNVQQLIAMHIDCDGDAIVCRVRQLGVACHTGRKHCFYLDVDIANGHIVVN